MERTIKTVHVADTKATTLRDALLSAVKGFGLNPEKCRGQGYDGASNMSGKHNGLAALFKMVCKHAMYTHCCAHRLNLIVEIIGKDVAEYQSVLGFLQQIYNLISASPKRVAMFENFQHENHVKPTSLSVKEALEKERTKCSDSKAYRRLIGAAGLMQLVAASSILLQSSRLPMESKTALTARQIKRQLHLVWYVELNDSCFVSGWMFLLRSYPSLTSSTMLCRNNGTPYGKQLG